MYVHIYIYIIMYIYIYIYAYTDIDIQSCELQKLQAEVQAELMEPEKDQRLDLRQKGCNKFWAN